ncbi:carbonic anhydrase [Flavilitoribacter nigricans]|uniref:Carbonic anhydrase n=1 Tax=Flavilitoribacter nigricans (strain ATCC 23147 / DSM 23189 / NBRC 102662 / NCIMB 1420 / SS-2) TaxID=1122177 RepID=A0A2D0NA22_FLAN2|nr:carbonic anhydrase family protein [Flavilitoribacter nigricans]PHN04633.1 hypothetical protein CRP01_21780 [Flavilitoribacter nigricans DSM 23189 = NBRC 102662]
MQKLLIFFTLSLLMYTLIHSYNRSRRDSGSEPAAAATHWGYEGEVSPVHWGELTEDYLQCAEGHFQSPIDIESYRAEAHPGSILDFKYHPSPVDIVNNGHTVQANLEEENVLVANAHDYQLRQIHFHEPSEHRIDGVIYPMEMHMVHTDSTGKLAVVGILIKEGPPNEFLNTLWEALPEHPEEHAHPATSCDIVHLLPEEHNIYHYSGSLTTPPCTEGVEWFVMGTPISLSKTQIDKFRKIYHNNNRPVQENTEGRVELVY